MMSVEYFRMIKDYRVKNGIITAPGKFEGEPIYAPYFWEQYLDGGCDREEGDEIIFDVTSEDQAKFPELVGIKSVALREDDNGFIYCRSI